MKKLIIIGLIAISLSCSLFAGYIADKDEIFDLVQRCNVEHEDVISVTAKEYNRLSNIKGVFNAANMNLLSTGEGVKMAIEGSGISADFQLSMKNGLTIKKDAISLVRGMHSFLLYANENANEREKLHINYFLQRDTLELKNFMIKKFESNSGLQKTEAAMIANNSNISFLKGIYKNNEYSMIIANYFIKNNGLSEVLTGHNSAEFNEFLGYIALNDNQAALNVIKNTNFKFSNLNDYHKRFFVKMCK